MRLRAALWWTSLGLGVIGACLWVRVYAEVPFLAGAICLIAASALAGWGSSISEGRRAATSHWALGAAIAACVVAIPFVSAELRVAVGIVTFGAVATMSPSERTKRAGAGVVASGLSSLLLVGATGLYVRFAASYHEAPALRALESGIARVLGLGTATVGREIILPAGSCFAPVVPSWDQFGLIFGVLLVFGVVGFALLTRGSRGLGRAAAQTTGLVTAYLIVRYVLLLLVALELGRPSVFWVPSITFATIAPLAFLLPRYAGVRAEWDPMPLIQRGSVSPRRAWLVAATALLGTFLASLSLLLAPAGTRSSGRILFDEAHGEWETTAREMDTEWYGMASTYNYDSLYRWLDGYYETGRVLERIDAAGLEQGDVLVLKTPSVPYSSDEIHAIVAHVQRGGGLLVIGDHTNVFGTTSVLNPVLAPFGLQFGYDATYRLRDGGFTTYEPRSAVDPVFQHVSRFDFLTSCSLHGGLFALPLIYDGRILASAADYSTRNFFPEGRITLTSTFGMFLQAAGTEAGRGRVVAFTDSTCFSNFSLHMDGYTGFLLGALEYLRRQNPLPGWRPIAAIAGILCATVGLAAGISARRRAVLTVGLVSIALGWGAAVATTAVWHHTTYPVPLPRHDVPYVYFDISASRARISSQPLVANSLGTRGAFGTFFTWTQRVGLVPSLVSTRTSLVEGRPYVVINPEGVPSASRNRVVDYVRNKGGSLVLLGDPVRDRGGLDEYCALFGLAVVRAQSDSLILSTGKTVQTVVSPAQTIFTSVAPAGAGRVVLLSDSVAFSDLALGGGFAVPSVIQRRLYDLEFWLFGTLLASPP
ncbi:MAG: DUF4350 domain-containing protein [Thermotogota bacterium]